MATFTVNTSGTTNNSGHKYTPATDTYESTRFYTSVDLSAETRTIAAATFYFYLSAITGSSSYRLFSDWQNSGWGASLTADATDFDSTQTSIEDTKTPTATGWNTWAVNPNNLQRLGTTWFKLVSCQEGDATTENITLNTQNNASNKPYLHLTFIDGATQLLALGVGPRGLASTTQDYNGPTADGQIRATNVGAPYNPVAP